jgi:hypothetical protein
MGEEFGAVAYCVGQVGHRYRVLGADIAPGAAIPAPRAARLLNAHDVGVGLEADRDSRGDHVVAERLACRFQRPVLGKVASARVALRIEPLAGAAKALLEQPVLNDLAGPALVREHARVGSQRHARIDQRAAAKPAADEHVHVIAEPHVVQRRRRSGAQAFARHLHFILQIGKAGGKLARKHLTAALEHSHRLAGARQPRGSDATAIPRAHHDYVVAVANMLERA